MSKKIKGIVIKANDKKEKDKSVLLFSLEEGKVWATLRGVKGQNSKMKLAQTPFCFGEFLIEEGKGGLIITGFETIETFHELCEDVDKFFEASAVLETVKALEFSNNQELSKIFLLVLNALKAICFKQISNLYVLDKFLIELFKISGFPLYSDSCLGCGMKLEKVYIDYNIGELLCPACKNYSCEEINKPAYMALKIFNSNDFSNLETLKLAQNSEFVLLRILVKNFEGHFDKKLNFVGILS